MEFAAGEEAIHLPESEIQQRASAVSCAHDVKNLDGGSFSLRRHVVSILDIRWRVPCRDMDKPLVSILTPSYNQARWLKDNLRSVGSQTYPAIEHIVMDGGSTDGSCDILDAAGNVRWWSEPDRGQSHALNKAFEKSDGEIIGWINSDDAYFDAGVVSAVVDCFVRNPSVGVVYGHAAQVNAEGLILVMIWLPPFNHRLLRIRTSIAQPACFIRRSVLAGLFIDESFDYKMDHELWLRLAARQTKFRRIPRVLAVDRHYPSRKSAVLLDVLHRENKRLAERYGFHLGRRWDVLRAAIGVVFRLIGVWLLPKVGRDLAFKGHHDGVWSLLQRQIATRRRNMPLGADTKRSGATGAG